MIHQLARESNLDVYALGLDQAKWEYRLNEYTQLVVKECVAAFYETRMEPSLEKYILNRLGIESVSSQRD
jgi:hypothetical protein